MVLLEEAVKDKKFDVRMTERYVSRGILSPQELSDALKTLPDDSASADWVNVESLMDSPSETGRNSSHHS